MPGPALPLPLAGARDTNAPITASRSARGDHAKSIDAQMIGAVDPPRDVTYGSYADEVAELVDEVRLIVIAVLRRNERPLRCRAPVNGLYDSLQPADT
jgi:hypothetical protein